MKRLLLLVLIGCFVVAGGLLTLAQEEETVEFYVRCWARPPMESWRGDNIVLAVAELNADLEAAGDPRRVEVNLLQDDPRDWAGYITEFLLGYGVGEAPDIWLTGHEYIGAQAEAGRIVALDELMKEFPRFNNVIDSLWDSTSYKGEIWGVPQDAEARPLYFNKALLGELGWTANEIAALPEKIEKGEFTLYDMLAVAKEAVDKGVVADGNGFWTRPKNGADFTAFYYAFGGETIDTATGKLVFDEAAGLQYYQFFYDAAQNYGSMACLHGDWSLWHGTITDGKVLFWVGGTWQWADWAEHHLQELGGEDYMWENWGFGLIPAAEEGGQPNSLTHPLVYTISSQCEHPDLALALIDKVTNYEPNTRHAIASNHLGILKSQTEYGPYAEARFLSETLYMLHYTTFLPNNPYWGPYSTITYEALAAVVGDDFTPQEAVEFVVDGLQRELGDMVVFVVTFELGEPQLALNLEVWEEDESRVFYSADFPPEGLKTITMALAGDPPSAELPFAWAQLGWEDEGPIEASAEVTFWIPLGYEEETEVRATLQFASAALKSPRKVKDYLAGVGSDIKGHITGKTVVSGEDKLEIEYTLEWEEGFKSYTFKGTIVYKEWNLTFTKTRDQLSISTDIPDRAFPITIVGLSITKKDDQYLMSGKASLPFKTLSEKTPGVLVWDLDEQVVELNILTSPNQFYEIEDRDGNVKCSVKVSGLRFDLKKGKCHTTGGRLEMSWDEYLFRAFILVDEYTAEFSSKKHSVKLSVKGRTKDGKVTSVSTSAESDKVKLEVTAKSLDEKDKDIKATITYKDKIAKVAVTYEKKGSGKKKIGAEVTLNPDPNTEITLSAERKIRIKGYQEATRNEFSIAVTQQVELSPNIKMQAELRIRYRDGQGNLPPSIQIPDGTGPILKAEITKQRGIKRPWFAIFLFWTWKF